MTNQFKVRVQIDTWNMCKDQQNAEHTDGETNVQKKKSETM